VGQGGHGFLLSEEERKNKVFNTTLKKRNYITINYLPVEKYYFAGLIPNNKELKKTLFLIF